MTTVGTRPRHSASAPSVRTMCASARRAVVAAAGVCMRRVTTSNGVIEHAVITPPTDAA
eukprot:CAMPEP_0198346900 /NCGR_PEP_ID=MMETSP1450-20131203/82180_1 /TAXON_ID=753684 ORGANISM="Madagascaria erythrocladiodes, Strain CCMP3234" /NCGR_SAMPLE_ID=MMETSP1450 /ASSEMBLY_ACC=CAM_ASM_001115 /LENGTH=58 /DNA_ID=CAMNT_0044052377 /DNA_START=91 /DNA_END=264 /DNA_ORIENTATION=-